MVLAISLISCCSTLLLVAGGHRQQPYSIACQLDGPRTNPLYWRYNSKLWVGFLEVEEVVVFL
jgi:hypothetical protein